MARHASVSEKTERHLLRVKEFILEHPRSFNMGSWVENPLDLAFRGIGEEGHPCGTVACLAGFIVTLDQNLHNCGDCRRVPSGFHEGETWKEAAIAIAGLKPTKAQALFYTDGWPGRMGSEYDEAYENMDFDGAAQIAAERIDYFIEYGE